MNKYIFIYFYKYFKSIYYIYGYIYIYIYIYKYIYIYMFSIFKTFICIHLLKLSNKLKSFVNIRNMFFASTPERCTQHTPREKPFTLLGSCAAQQQRAAEAGW